MVDGPLKQSPTFGVLCFWLAYYYPTVYMAVGPFDSIVLTILASSGLFFDLANGPCEPTQGRVQISGPALLHRFALTLQIGRLLQADP